MRRFAHGNPRINFGWCKGDDNFGGRQRKELDDFTKSLGKQMNLVMYRMQDTENIRMRLRERARQEVRDKFEKEEREEKERDERLERNRKWRQRKEGGESLEEEEKELDENEKRKLKNKEWRLKRESPEGSIDENHDNGKSNVRLIDIVMAQLVCDNCHQEMSPPMTIHQTNMGHNVCGQCCDIENIESVGPNTALMKVAEIVLGGKYKHEDFMEDDDESLDFTLKADEEESIDFQEPIMDSLKEVKNLENI